MSVEWESTAASLGDDGSTFYAEDSARTRKAAPNSQESYPHRNGETFPGRMGPGRRSGE